MFNRKIRSYLVSYVWYSQTTAGQGNVIIGMRGRFRKRYVEKYLRKTCNCLKVIVLNYVERGKDNENH